MTNMDWEALSHIGTKFLVIGLLFGCVYLWYQFFGD